MQLYILNISTLYLLSASPCFFLSFFFQACKMSCQSSCVGVLWRQPSAMWHATRRASCSAARTTAGAGARPASQNATVPSLTSRSWRRTWRRANRPGAASTKSSWNQVRTGTLIIKFSGLALRWKLILMRLVSCVQ